MQPLGRMILVKAEPAEEKTKGGIELPSNYQPPEQLKGEVKATGPGVFESGMFVPVIVKMGDRVLFQSGHAIRLDFLGPDMLLMPDGAVLGILGKDE